MRGLDERRDGALSHIRAESRIPRDHPLRVLRLLVDQALAALEEQIVQLCVGDGRPFVPVEQLLRALLQQAFTRSTRSGSSPSNSTTIFCPGGSSGFQWAIRRGCPWCSARTVTVC